MSAEQDLRALKTLDLFAGLPDLAVQEVYTSARIEKRSEGEYFFFQGDPASAVYVLASGRVKLLQLTTDGQQVILRMAVAWTPIGLVGTVSNATYPVTAEAVEDCRALCWSHDALQHLMTKYPRIAQNAMQAMAFHVQEFQDRFREMATERVERRLARALLRLASQLGKKTEEGVEIAMPVSRQELAEMSGTTLFTVSRILSEWERQGLIRTGRERVVIVHPHGLVRIAEDLPPAR